MAMGDSLALPAGPERGPRGFTLFEVMAAVIVLGMLYSVLATSAIQGLRSEGESKRRMEASLLVDELLMEIEANIAIGESPPVGRTEEEIEHYQVVTEVVPFDLMPYLGEEFSLEEMNSTLLLPTDDPDDSFLRVTSVVVRWLEAEGEHEVRRTTLTYDAAAVADLFPSEGGGQAPAFDETGLTNPDGTANLEAMLEIINQMSGGSQ